MKAKKIITSFLLVLFLCANVLFSACSLVTLNNKVYLNQTVATAGDITITMEDLINGYNSFGYSYTEDNGGSYTTKEAVKKTLDDLVSRELLVKYSKETLGELTITEQNEVYAEVFEYINSELKSYEEEIIKERDLDEVLTDESDEDGTKLTQYEKKIERVYNETTHEYEYVRVTDNKQEDTKLNDEFQQVYHGSKELGDEAMRRLIKQVRNSDNDLKYKSNNEVLEYEINRAYKTYEKNKYISRLQENFEQNQLVDKDAIVEKYKELVRNSLFTYYYNEDSYNEKMQDEASEVYYQPFGDKYIQVAHILIKYSDIQTKEIEALEADKNSYVDPTEYDIALKNIASEIKTSDGITPSELCAEIQTALNNATTTYPTLSEDEAKLKVFLTYVEKYNEDEGIETAFNSQTQYYSINLDTSVKDSMIKEFADASRSLYSEDGSTDFTMYYEPVLGQYGYHIIFSVGTVKNLVDYKNLDSITCEQLYNMSAMVGTNKSMFDKMAELVDNADYSEFQASKLLELKQELEIKYYENIYKKLYE